MFKKWKKVFFFRESREAKKAKSYEGFSSKGRFYIQDKPRFKKMFSNQVHGKYPKAHDNMVYNPMYPKGRGTRLPSKNPICGKFGKKHYGDCLVGKDTCFVCCRRGHKVREFPNVKGQDKGSRKAQASG